MTAHRTIIPVGFLRVIDIALSVVSLYIAGSLRYDMLNPARWGDGISLELILLLFGGTALLNSIIFHFSGLYKNLRVYASLEEFLQLSRSVAIATVVPPALLIFSEGRVPVSFSVIFIYGAVLLLLLGLRSVAPALSNYLAVKRIPRRGNPAILVGAGVAGNRIAGEFLDHPDLHRIPCGFVDDDPAKIGGFIRGIPVLGPTNDLDEVLNESNAREVIITTRLPANKIRMIHRTCEKRGIPCKFIPGYSDLLRKAHGRPDLEEISLEDLLGREVVRLETDGILKALQNKTVLISGAGGSIGSEVCRQIIRFKPAVMILLDNAETPLYEIDYELRNEESRERTTRIHSVIGDIRDTELLKQIFRNHDIQVVFHCAAYKHVPMMELNAGEAVMNNIIGTRNIADASRDHGVERFVMISTDKAVNPVNIMGATKRIAELYIQNLARVCDTKFITVRFGNVLGSSGSVIPLFKKQIATGGPVTVTHPEIIRYFMTIEEAAGLVIQAGAMGQEGEIFILDMGEPVKIKDLAEDMIRLAGYEPHKDIEIQYIGLRPGEKLFEELLLAEEGIQPTRHEKIHIARSRFVNLNTLGERIGMLEKGARKRSRRAVDSVIAGILPEYRPVYIVGDNHEDESAEEHGVTVEDERKTNTDNHTNIGKRS